MSTATGSINILLMAEFVAPFSPNFATKSQTSQTRWFTTYQHKHHQPKKQGSFNPSNMTSWWLNHPFEKYARRIGSFPPIFGAKTKIYKTNENYNWIISPGKNHLGEHKKSWSCHHLDEVGVSKKQWYPQKSSILKNSGFPWFSPSILGVFSPYFFGGKHTQVCVPPRKVHPGRCLSPGWSQLPSARPPTPRRPRGRSRPRPPGCFGVRRENGVGPNLGRVGDRGEARGQGR